MKLNDFCSISAKLKIGTKKNQWHAEIKSLTKEYLFCYTVGI